MPAYPRAAGVLHGRFISIDAEVLVQARRGPTQFPRDSLLPQEADSGLNVRDARQCVSAKVPATAAARTKSITIS